MSFKNIQGHARSVGILQRYLEDSRLSGGYLFTGPEGTGKKLVALTLAKALNCSEGKADSCDACVSCGKIDRSDHPDVHLLASGDDEIKIETIRQLQKELSFRPYEGKVKVFIIDNAHKLTADAANCLLKVLEEPPKQSLIILISDKPALLFRTIVSRCKTVKFSSMPRKSLEQALSASHGLDAGMSHFLAYFSEGRIGSALSLKDTGIVQKKNECIDKFILSDAGLSERGSKQERQELKRQLGIIATWFRDIYMLKIGMPHQELINLDRKDELLRSMGKFTFDEIDDILQSVSDAVLYLDQNINSKLVMQSIGVQLWKA
jgi:DNA polymerase-3 subunit delta'